MESQKGFEQVKGILDEYSFSYQESLDDFAFYLPFKGEDFSSDVTIIIDNEYFILESTFPVKVPSDKFDEVSLFFSHLNVHFKMGHFFVYRNLGEVAFRATGMFNTTGKNLEKLISLTLNMVENHMKSVMSIAFGDKDPVEVYRGLFNDSTVGEKVGI
ncbi:hypothetical protein ASD24_26815 [Paenibacillus sp. Root52]|uniref:YbjN domain-containing protein n=1 Tax=Paenibacillus sp. Root52 TaxID=1736552 RepID=UPI0006FF201B|nr:YbjN domain-containing protein [Paenibacillus sp. Root52]KQY87090.1 hypothetical protein ASD24_26815 [Paenibacillus sp. Root52]